MPPEEAAAVRSSGQTPRHRLALRVATVGLLAIIGVPVAYGASPWNTGHCECAHGPEVDCDCPHHAGGADLPPCHRAKRAAKQHPGGVALKAKCGSTSPDLLVVALLSTSHAGSEEFDAIAADPSFEYHGGVVEKFWPPPRQPPRRGHLSRFAI